MAPVKFTGLLMIVFVIWASLLLMILATVSSQRGPKLTPSNTFLGGRANRNVNNCQCLQISSPSIFYGAVSRHGGSTLKSKTEFPSRHTDFASA